MQRTSRKARQRQNRRHSQTQHLASVNIDYRNIGPLAKPAAGAYLLLTQYGVCMTVFLRVFT